MKAVWKRIHAWLDENAPKNHGRLRPGASAETIRAAEKAMGLKLPADVKASYRIHDGQRDEPGLIGGEGWCLLPLREMVKLWQQWSQSNPKDKYYVPIAWGTMGDIVFLDLRPDAKKPGCLMVWRKDGYGSGPIAPSFRLWLEDFADKLDDGEFAYSKDEGCIMYADEMDMDLD